MPDQKVSSTQAGSMMMATSLSYAINIACPEIINSMKKALSNIGYGISDDKQGRYNLYDSVTSSEVSYTENKLHNDFKYYTTDGFTQSCIDNSSLVLGVQDPAANHGDILSYYNSKVIESSDQTKLE
jgi:hypothetical protein